MSKPAIKLCIHCSTFTCINFKTKIAILSTIPKQLRFNSRNPKILEQNSADDSWKIQPDDMKYIIGSLFNCSIKIYVFGN